MAGATAGGRAGTAAAIKRRRKKEALSQVCADKLCQYSSYDRFYLGSFLEIPRRQGGCRFAEKISSF